MVSNMIQTLAMRARWPKYQAATTQAQRMASNMIQTLAMRADGQNTRLQVLPCHHRRAHSPSFYGGRMQFNHSMHTKLGFQCHAARCRKNAPRRSIEWKAKRGWTAAAVVPLGVDRFYLVYTVWVRREPGFRYAPIFIEIGREVVVLQRFWSQCSLPTPPAVAWPLPPYRGVVVTGYRARARVSAYV